MKRFAFLLAVAACGGDDRPERIDRIELPGTIWFVDDEQRTLVRLHAGVRTEIFGGLFPSAHVLPDGRLVAIASRGDGSAESEQLALVSANGSVQRIGPAATSVRDPAVDPRGRWIVVAANLDGHSDLYRVGLDLIAPTPGRVERLTNDPQGNYRPAIIGDSIVYVSSRDGDAEIYRDSQRLTAFHRDDWDPTPSPDGRTIAFMSDREGTAKIFVMSPDGTDLRRLTTGTAEESELTWSPDGRQLAYVADRRVWVRDIATGVDRAITAVGTAELEPSFSPDGRWLAVARVTGHDSDLWATPLDGRESTLIAKGARLPRWR